MKAGKLFMTLRLALTGAERLRPSMVTQILGADEVRRRLQLTLEALTEAA